MYRLMKYWDKEVEFEDIMEKFGNHIEETKRYQPKELEKWKNRIRELVEINPELTIH